MMKQLLMTEDEQELIVKGLYDWRNALESDCLLRPELEELILKVIDAPVKKSFFQKGVYIMIEYHLEGDYWIPDLTAPESPKIGIWGERRRRFLRDHRRPFYTSLLMTGKLNTHLEEVDQSASKMEERLTAQFAEREHITEELKAEDQMTWVQAMNSIRNRVEEIVRRELVEVD